jgi:DNA-binding transcriptional regulator YiaG
MSPAEIVSLRETYGLTQRGLSNLLGMGEVTIHRYENGSIPDEANNQLLQMLQDPWNMQRLLKERGSQLPRS